jgi:hypothetical protein
MRLTNVTVDGLQNVYLCDPIILTATESGYEAAATLRFGHYAGDSATKLPPVSLAGRFHVELGLCSAFTSDIKKGIKKCNGTFSEAISGEGDFKLNFTALLAEITFKLGVAGTGNGRTLQVVAESLRIQYETRDRESAIVVKELTIDTRKIGFVGNWKESATKVLQSADGANSLLQNLQATLSQPANLESISQAFTAQFTTALHSLFGPVSPADSAVSTEIGPRNVADRLLFDRARAAVNDVRSPIYLPKLLLGSSSPNLDPYLGSTISLGPQQISKRTRLSDVSITSPKLTGISNAAALPDKTYSRDGLLHMQIDLGSLNPPPQITGGKTISAAPVKLEAGFSITSDRSGRTETGSMSTTLATLSIQIEATASGENANDLVINVKGLSVCARELSQVNLKVQLDSEFCDVLNDVLNEPSIKNQLIGQLNSQLSANLEQISRSVTDQIRSLIANQL